VPVVVVPTDHGLHGSRLLRNFLTSRRALPEPLSRRREGPSAVAASPEAAGVRIWQIASRAWRPRAGRSSPQASI